MPVTPKQTAGVADFDAQSLAVEAHEKHITILTEKVAKIEGNLNTPQALAEFFKESAKDSRVLEDVFAQMFCRFINENESVKTAVEKKIGEIDRRFFYKTFKRLWLPVYTGFAIVFGLIAKELVQWLVSLLPHVKPGP